MSRNLSDPPSSLALHVTGAGNKDLRVPAGFRIFRESSIKESPVIIVIYKCMRFINKLTGFRKRCNHERKQTSMKEA